MVFLVRYEFLVRCLFFIGNFRCEKNPTNGLLLLLFLRTNSESQCGKEIHKKSVGKAGNSNFLNFPLSPLIFYVLLSRIDFQSSSVAFLSRKPHCGHSSKPAGIGLGKSCFHREILLSRISWRTIPNSPAGNF